MANNLNTSKGLQIWLPLTKNLNNQGISGLKFSGVTVVTTGGKLGGCYTASNYTSGLISDKKIDLGANQTFCAWFKFTSLNKNSSLGGTIVSQHEYLKNTGLGITLKYVSSTTGYISCNTGNGSSRTYNTYCGNTLLQANTWYHVVMTYTGGIITFYINGVQDGQHSVGTMSVPSNYIVIGNWATDNNSYGLNGQINDVRVYSYALSPQEIKDISRGLVGHWLGESTGFIAKNLASNTDGERNSLTEYMQILSSYSDPGVGECTFSCWMKIATGTSNINIYSEDGTYDAKYRYRVSDIYVDRQLNGKIDTQWRRVVCKLTFYNSVASSTIMPHISTYYNYDSGRLVSVRNPKLEKGWNDNSIYVNSSRSGFLSDISGNHLNLEVKGNGITLNTNTPRYDKCLSFDGNGYLETNNLNINSSEPHTLSFWFYPKSSGQMICSFNNGLNLYTYGNYISLNDGDGINNRFDNWQFTLNTWYHIAITFNGSTARLYVNGEDKGTAPTYRPLNGPKMIIGTYINGTSYRYTGMLSDMRLYATALDTTAIQELKDLGH